jgi:hypothetical protein
VASEQDPEDPTEPTAFAALAEPLRRRCAEIGHPESDLPEPAGVDAGYPTFGTRHYLFRVARRPPAPDAEALPPRSRPLEVYAWPRTMLPPGRTVFFLPSDGRGAFTRNLAAAYAGFDRAPPSTAALPRETVTDSRAYRSADDERWIFLPAR